MACCRAHLRCLIFSLVFTDQESKSINSNAQNDAGTELSERICVMGISMNLVTYLVGDLHLSSAKSATIVTNFLGALNLLGLLGGFLADAKLGRYLTVATFASITAVVSYEPLRMISAKKFLVQNLA